MGKENFDPSKYTQLGLDIPEVNLENADEAPEIDEALDRYDVGYWQTQGWEFQQGCDGPSFLRSPDGDSQITIVNGRPSFND